MRWGRPAPLRCELNLLGRPCGAGWVKKEYPRLAASRHRWPLACSSTDSTEALPSSEHLSRDTFVVWLGRSTDTLCVIDGLFKTPGSHSTALSVTLEAWSAPCTKGSHCKGSLCPRLPRASGRANVPGLSVS